jgi:hypothetical protein
MLMTALKRRAGVTCPIERRRRGPWQGPQQSKPLRIGRSTDRTDGLFGVRPRYSTSARILRMAEDIFCVQAL